MKRIYLMLPIHYAGRRSPTHARAQFCNPTKLGEAMEFLLGLAIGTSLGASLGVFVVAWLWACKDEGSRHDYAKPD